MTAPPLGRPPRYSAAAVVQLVVSCLVLGAGVTLLLQASLGSDGYSTLVNGIVLTTGWPFVVVNCLVGAALVAMAWVRGTRPGLGTVVQPLVVGAAVTAGLVLVPAPGTLAGRSLMLVASFVLLTLGVAGYLASATGAGPTEAAALAWDPPVPFRWSYGVVQGGGALVGWLLGAAVGPGTVAVVLALGPAVHAVTRLAPWLLRQGPEPEPVAASPTRPRTPR